MRFFYPIALAFAPLLFAVSPSRAEAQNAGDASMRDPIAEMVFIAGTPPEVRGNRTFRIAFRLVSKTGEPFSYAAVSESSGNARLFGWSAYTAGKANCTLFSRRLTNTPVYFGLRGARTSRLGAYDGSESLVAARRPAILSADFECDNNIFVGEEISIQITLYYKTDREWQKADYFFEKLVLES